MAAGAEFPRLPLDLVGGGAIDLSQRPGWRALIVYRGRHCPLCRKYLATLDGLLDRFEQSGVSVLAASADPLDRAQAEVEEEGWRFPVACGLTVDQMRTLGLYVSEPRSPQETDRPFAEPGVFVINPQGRVQIVDVSNAPFARPDLEALLRGIDFVREKDYPVRGTM